MKIILYYLYLLIAIAAEVSATSAMKACDGFTRFWPSMIVVIGYAIAFYFFSLTVKHFSIGISYAIWAGVGIILTAIVGWFMYKQPLDTPAIIGMILIMIGVLVINLFSKSVMQ